MVANNAFEFQDNSSEREMSAYSARRFSCRADGPDDEKRNCALQNSLPTKDLSMPSSKKLVHMTIFTAFTLSLYLFGAAAPCRAQASAVSSDDAYPFSTNALRPWVTPASVVADSVSTDQPTNGDPAGAPPPQAAKSAPDDGWHLAVSPYLWFPGAHGTIEGPNGNGIGFHASAGDLLSHFQIGLMGAVQASHKRIVTSVDIFWIRLEDDQAIPLPPAVGDGAISAKAHATEFFLAPKVGYRVIDQEKIKIDALAGLRYWHLGESLSFNPSVLGINFTGSQNFVDPIVGGRIEMALSPKIVINILGDVGGWNTGSKLEYEFAGLIGYRIKPALTLQVGYRYLNLDYVGSRGNAFDMTTDGVIFGVTINLK
jgi:YfaZ precursor